MFWRVKLSVQELEDADKLACARHGRVASRTVAEFIDYKTSIIADEDPLRGLLFY